MCSATLPTNMMREQIWAFTTNRMNITQLNQFCCSGECANFNTLPMCVMCPDGGLLQLHVFSGINFTLLIQSKFNHFSRDLLDFLNGGPLPKEANMLAPVPPPIPTAQLKPDKDQQAELDQQQTSSHYEPERKKPKLEQPDKKGYEQFFCSSISIG